MNNSHRGTILRVDLSSGEIKTEPMSQGDKENYIGGRGLNAKTLFDEVKAGTDAFSPENKLILGLGPLVGTRAPSSSRITITAMSPLCTYGESNIGGVFSIQLKHAGYDQVIISGRSEKPVYLSIVDDKVELKDAGHLWGMESYETQDEILKTADADAQVICIGPAGENLVRYACIKGSGKNAAGRTGLGAVMGSKNLKAIVARGTGSTQLAKPKEFLEIGDTLHEKIEALSDFINGLCAKAVVKNFMVDPGLAIVGNYEASSMEGWTNEHIDQFDKDHVEEYVGCADCPVRCYARTKVQGKPKTIVACYIVGDFTARLKTTDMVSMVEHVELVNRMGLDSASTGAVIALIYELYDKGVLTKEDAEDIPLDRRDKDTVNILIRKIASREGKIGKLFAEGSIRAAREIGKGAEHFVVHTRGLEPPLADTRIVKGKGLSNAVVSRGESTRAFGPSEMSSFESMLSVPGGVEKHEAAKKQMKELYGTEKAAFHYTYEGKAELINTGDLLITLYDLVGACKFTSDLVLQLFGTHVMLKMLSLATGKEWSEEEAFAAAERTVNIERAILAREGITRDDDDLGEKIFNEPTPSGPYKGAIMDRDRFEMMKSKFYNVRGWSVETGTPERKRLEELGLGHVADELDKYSKPSS
jgi:aldehyde:ferredoxin oxidoreductase